MARKGAAGFSPARLRGALAEAGKTPAELARAAAVPPSIISKYAAGRASPQPPRLALLACALGVPAAALLEVPEAGEGLTHIRAAAGLTQAQLAGQAGIGQKRYELAELGQRPLSDDDITQIAGVTGASPARIRAARDRAVTRFKAPVANDRN